MTGGIVLQLAFDTLATAGIYAIVGMGVLVAHSGTRVLHLAIGQVAMAGALVAASLASTWPLWISVIAGLAVAAAISAGGERALVAPLARRVEIATILLIAGAVVLREVLSGVFSNPAYGFASVGGVVHPLGSSVRAADILTIATAVAAALVGTWILRSTIVGAALRATAADPDNAELLGVDVARVRSAAFGVAGVLAAGAALLAAGRLPIAATAGVPFALKGIAAAVAGRLSSPFSVCIAAVVIGGAQVVGTYFLGSGGEVAADAVALVLLIGGWRR